MTRPVHAARTIALPSNELPYIDPDGHQRTIAEVAVPSLTDTLGVVDRPSPTVEDHELENLLLGGHLVVITYDWEYLAGC